VVTITVDPVNDAPVHVMPTAQAMIENGVLTLDGVDAIRLTDIDAGAGGLLEVTLTAANGTMTLASLAGLTFITGDGADDATLVFSGTLANINAALDGLTFNPNAGYDGAAGVAPLSPLPGSVPLLSLS